MFIHVKITINYVSILISHRACGILLQQVFRKQMHVLCYLSFMYYIWLFELGLRIYK